MARARLIATLMAASLIAASAHAAPPAATPAPAPQPAQPAVQGPDPAAQLEATQQRLLAAQQVIATLERQLAEEHNRAAALEQCRLRNGHLVSIGRQLIDGYARRYGERKSHDPLQLPRRRFEFELQALSGAIYDMKADVPLRSLPGGAAVAPPEGDAAKPAAAPAPAAKPAAPPAAPPAPAAKPAPEPAKPQAAKPATGGHPR